MQNKKRLGQVIASMLVLAAFLVTPILAAEGSESNTEEGQNNSVTTSVDSTSETPQNGPHSILIPVKVNGIGSTILLLSDKEELLQSIPFNADEEKNITLTTDELDTFHYKAKVKEEDTKTASYDHTVFDIEVMTYLDEGGKWCYTVEASYNNGNKNVKPDLIEFDNKEIKAPVTPSNQLHKNRDRNQRRLHKCKFQHWRKRNAQNR